VCFLFFQLWFLVLGCIFQEGTVSGFGFLVHPNFVFVFDLFDPHLILFPDSILAVGLTPWLAALSHSAESYFGRLMKTLRRWGVVPIIDLRGYAGIEEDGIRAPVSLLLFSFRTRRKHAIP
jgi:hypothetical protein